MRRLFSAITVLVALWPAASAAQGPGSAGRQGSDAATVASAEVRAPGATPTASAEARIPGANTTAPADPRAPGATPAASAGARVPAANAAASVEPRAPEALSKASGDSHSPGASVTAAGDPYAPETSAPASTEARAQPAGGTPILVASAARGPEEAPAAGSAAAPAASVAATPSAAQQADSEAPVQLLERTVFIVRTHRGSASPQERARDASHVLERAAQLKDVPEVRVDEGASGAGVAVVYVGESPLIQLGAEDATAAGDSSLSVHAAAVASTVREVLAKEHSRSRIATSVFNFSILVFSGLIALLLLRKLGELVEKARRWVVAHPKRLPEIRVQGIEVLRPAAFQGALSVALGAARVLALIGIVYTWILFALSLFEATHGISQRLSGFVFAPVSDLMTRVAQSVPVLVLAILATLAVLVLIRFVGLFFGSVGRGETALGWLPSDLAVPTGVLVRLGIVVATLVLAAPLITGAEEGALTRVGFVVIASAGLASTPLVASVAVGIAVIYGRRLRVGDVAEVGGCSGRVRELTLVEARIEDDDGCVVRVPHLLSLVHPTRLLGKPPLIVVDVAVAASADLEQVRELLVTTASNLGTRARAALVALDDGGAHFRATMAADGPGARSRWLIAIATALSAAGIPLGRARATFGAERGGLS